MSPGSTIEARRLTRSYGRRRGIIDVELEVHAGEVLGLLGANGAGKTTFMRTLLDFIRPTSGSVQVLGLDSVRDSVEVRRRTSYLPGELSLPPRLRGYDIVNRFTVARRNLDPARVRDLADRFGLDLSRRVRDLSKGNKQKLGLVLAFAPDVPLLVLDEPTSGLDPLLQREFITLVGERVGLGVTVLLSSHVMSEVEQIATRVALMREGRVLVVDEMHAIQSRTRRRARARPTKLAQVVKLAGTLAATPGIGEVAVDGDAVTFTCSGSVNPLITALGCFDIAALDIVQADLEDAFFSAYDDRELGPP